MMQNLIHVKVQFNDHEHIRKNRLYFLCFIKSLSVTLTLSLYRVLFIVSKNLSRCFWLQPDKHQSPVTLCTTIYYYIQLCYYICSTDVTLSFLASFVSGVGVFYSKFVAYVSSWAGTSRDSEVTKDAIKYFQWCFHRILTVFP